MSIGLDLRTIALFWSFLDLRAIALCLNSLNLRQISDIYLPKRPRRRSTNISTSGFTCLSCTLFSIARSIA
ncbi:MAG: hypothetical protein ACBR12_24500 [Microcoleus sp.]